MCENMCWSRNRTLVFPSCHSFIVTSYFVSRSAHFFLSSAVWFLSLRIIVYLHRKWAKLEHIHTLHLTHFTVREQGPDQTFSDSEKILWYCSLWFQGFYLTFQKQKLPNCILMDCQWFCDGFLAMCLTCWGSLGRFSVQESPLYGSSLSPAFQSNVADSEPHLHQICLRSGRRQKEMFFSTDINWLWPILVLLH